MTQCHDNIYVNIDNDLKLKLANDVNPIIVYSQSNWLGTIG